MFKWIKDFFTPASASFTKPEVNPQITDSVTQAQAAKPKRASAKSKVTAKPSVAKKATTKSPANKKAK